MLHRTVLAAAIFALIAAACGEDTKNNDEEPGPEVACPATATDLSGLIGTTHRGVIDTDAVWMAADSPHVVEANISVRNATLTVEPCAVVLVDADVHVTAGAGGSVQAIGTSESPIVFAAHESARWDYLLADEAGALSLAHVTLSGGGADVVTYDGATLVADGPTNQPYVENLDVQHVTITDSAGYGVLMHRHAAFASTSIDLTVSGAGSDDADHPSPLRIDGQALSSVPSGTYTGNAADRIEIDPSVAIEADVTISDHGVPYWVSNYTKMRVARAYGTTGAVPHLTIEAGVTLAFEPGSNNGFRVGTSGAEPGSLTISGTSAAPVTLTSAAATPAPGDWPGLVFAPGAGEAGASQSIDHAVIEYAGRNCAIGGYACYSTDGAGNVLPENGAVVIFGWAPAAPFVTNSTMQHSLGWGVFRGWNTSQGGDVDFTATNTFLDLEACEQNDIKDTCPGAGSSVLYSCAGTI
jgi:hypothetical protein